MAESILPVSEWIWRHRYRWGNEADLSATFQRVAQAVAQAEGDRAGVWARLFLDLLLEGGFLPGGRIIANAGTDQDATLVNCFVAGPITPSPDGLQSLLRESALTLQRGGGVGIDFSPVLPFAGSGAGLSGPVAWIERVERMCRDLVARPNRRAAIMATLRCDHPDIEAFIQAKQSPGRLEHCNLSVLVSDRFVNAVRADAAWGLVVDGRTVRTLPARKLWKGLTQAALESGEPGVLFIDRINRENNLAYAETITACNPCGEVPLPVHGACVLGSLNLTRFVRAPFQPGSHVDFRRLASAARRAVRFLDDVIDIAGFPLREQSIRARESRRIGLGLTGLANAFIFLGLPYDSDTARHLASRIAETIRDAAYDASIRLAQAKGAFKAFRPEPYLKSPFVQRLPNALRARIARSGLRNSHLLAIAPAGSISLLAGNVSSGIEPVLAALQVRKVQTEGGRTQSFGLTDYALDIWAQSGSRGGLPPAFVTAAGLSASAHLAMQSAIQPFIDNAISKTINLLEADGLDVYDIFLKAFDLGLKGCTVFRAGGCAGGVLVPSG